MANGPLTCNRKTDLVRHENGPKTVEFELFLYKQQLEIATILYMHLKYACTQNVKKAYLHGRVIDLQTRVNRGGNKNTPWENIKISPYYRPTVKYNLYIIQSYTILYNYASQNFTPGD